MAIMNDLSVGERMRIYRKKKNFTQKQMSMKLGLNETTYNRYETGKRSPDSDILSNFILITEADGNWLLTGKNGASLNKNGLTSIIPGLKNLNGEVVSDITMAFQELFENIESDKEHSLRTKDIPLVLEIIKALSNRFIMLTISKELIFAEQEFKEFKSKQSSGFAVQG
jgi:transcriptional regulator with XRE-family HTH domain